MRSLCEQAIIHLLNDDTSKAEALFKKFMVEKARQIHESLRQGEEIALTEGWDDEITSEEYFTEDDLAGVEDDSTGMMDDSTDPDASDDMGDMAADDALDSADTAVDDMDADAEDASEEGDEGNGVEERLDDVEAQIEALTAEFEAKMAEIDGDSSDDAEDVDADATDVGDEAADEDGELAGQMTDDMGAEADAASEDDGEHEDPALAEEDAFADDDMDDITESVLSDLERVTVDMTSPKEIGAGKSVKVDNKSLIPGSKVDSRKGGSPVEIKSTNAKGYARQPSPDAVKMTPRKNTRKDAFDGTEQVPAMGPKGAILNSDFAPSAKKNTPSLLSGVANKS